MRNSLRHIFLLIAVFLTAISSCPRAAQYDIAVFDFDAAKPGTPAWIGPCLADYAIRAINTSRNIKAVPRNELSRQITQMGFSSSSAPGFEQKETALNNLGAKTIIEGHYTIERNNLDFKGTAVNPNSGSIRDISFNIKNFTLEKAEDELIKRIAAVSGIKLSPSRNNLRGTASKQAHARYWQAALEYEEDRPDKALVLLTGAIEADSKFIPPRLLQARINIENTRFNTAIIQLEQCLAINPSSAETNYLLGLAYHLTRKNNEAKAFLRTAVEKAPGNAEYLLQLGIVYKNSTQSDKALEYFERAAKLSPNMAQVWYELAALYAVGGNNSRALDCLEQVLTFGKNTFLNKIRNDSDFDSLRNEKRYREIIRKVQQ